MTPWPHDYPEYHNANVDACDMVEGPCACGATHQKGEFRLVRYRKDYYYDLKILQRHGKNVAVEGIIAPNDVKDMKPEVLQQFLEQIEKEWVTQ